MSKQSAVRLHPPKTDEPAIDQDGTAAGWQLPSTPHMEDELMQTLEGYEVEEIEPGRLAVWMIKRIRR